ncbi:galactose-1-phosphate uridylyltransferase [Paenibacillus sp. J31TS4]|uniref:UDP-glucose--hexose-1-phosphate uridylyltransferase n=1 Tax=Paenibacillus sp. J31TS4 TaxID=2807195 RepID=UPI001B19D977|nr:UDP-glucose--hexose-1-phosphate uridylyltransferase [Paenibacillus sp. J31TS4]GIP37861.1 galactose-1-phosphate uridylyltransferase [Paenibacillus sp. J31TS4]
MKKMLEDGVPMHIERLVRYAVKKGLLDPFDVTEARNALLDDMKEPMPFEEDLPADEGEGREIEELLMPLMEAAVVRGLLLDDTMDSRDLFDTRLMGHLLPKPSTVASQFRRIAKEEGIQRATEALYRLSIDSGYIRMSRIRRNESWCTATEFGELELTINLTKPEKDPKEIAAERNAPQLHYPKCLLCADNVGYAGRVGHPARQNLRIIPLDLEGKRWYLQFSPYVYYDEHCIVFFEKHEPMRITEGTFRGLLTFVEQFPHYFIGSNADLPIVGGSILSHDHYQGGKHTFPMELAPVEVRFTHPNEPVVEVGLVRWPMSVIRLASGEREPLLKLATKILQDWRAYEDPDADILAYSSEGAGIVPHNSITPIARKNGAGKYELDLVLRNNRRSAEHPDGIFHPHAELHPIKKENIGLIEVMGFAVLPGRLKRELLLIEDILVGESSPGPIGPDHPLAKHAEWIGGLVETHGVGMQREEAGRLLRDEVGRIFSKVLEHAGVFKRDESGKQAFRAFMARSGFNPA